MNLTEEQIASEDTRLRKYPRIKFGVNHEINSLADIVYICLINTGYYNGSEFKNSRTVTIRSNREQCRNCAYRSCQDMFQLARFYLGNEITFKQVYDCLYKLLIDRVVNGNYCWVVRKNVFSYLNTHRDYISFVGHIDRLNLNYYKE